MGILRGYIFCLLLLLVIFTACNEKEDFYPDFPVGKEQLLTLDLSVDVDNVVTPLTKSTQGGLYGINVFWRKIGANGYANQPYAYGFFDDISNIRIGLVEGYVYQFDCTYIPSSDENIKYEMRNDSAFYGEPFSLTSGTDSPITNKLLISTETYAQNNRFLKGIYSGNIRDSYKGMELRPAVHRYFGSGEVTVSNYGNTENYLSIDLKRAYYTLSFGVVGLESGDSLRIGLDNGDNFLLIKDRESTAKEVVSQERFYSMNKIADYRRNPPLYDTESIPIAVSYRNRDSIDWCKLDVGGNGVTLKRNSKNYIRITNIEKYTHANGHISFTEGDLAGEPSKADSLTLEIP